MEAVVEDIVIVGAGIAGLTTSLGLHRLGLRSLVLESSDSLRTAGFAFGVWANGWRALDALGVGDILRQRHPLNRGFEFCSADNVLPMAELEVEENTNAKPECRCVKRKELLETLEKELPQGTIRYSSKVVWIEESGYFKLVHLADGCVIRTKVLIGCDGINSVVAKWLGLPNPISVGRLAVRGFVEYPAAHNIQPKIYAHFGGGVRFGIVPCGDKGVYWFCTYNESTANWHQDMAGDPVKVKEFVLSKMTNLPKELFDILERTKLDSIYGNELRIRLPWDFLIRNIAAKNVCVAGDALHPMTPDIAQGGCSALEDGVVLARCIGESFRKIQKRDARQGKEDVEEEEMAAIYQGVEKYVKCRRWRSFTFVGTALVVGFIQESDHKLIRFLREKFLCKYTIAATMKMADFDCGKLT